MAQVKPDEEINRENYTLGHNGLSIRRQLK